MAKKQVKKETKELKELKEISVKLDILTSIFKIAFNDQIEKAIKSSLATSDIKKTIYELCDGKNTVKTIAKKMNKHVTFVHTYLSRMEKEGILVKKGSKYYSVK